MNPATFDSGATDIVIPFYRNSHLVSPLFQSLRQTPVSVELTRLGCSLIAINDSPDDMELKESLQIAVSKMTSLLPVQLVENEQNIGFVRSVNRALRLVVSRGHNVIVLNSDTIVYPGTFTEMYSVAQLDPMIGFVSPRSNNATICSLPHQDQYKSAAPAESKAVFNELSRYLPRFQFVPVAVGFCLFIKCEVLKEFGLLDESYGWGYNEENDLIMRANRCGYRAAIANRAFVYHVGEASFSSSDSPKSSQESKNARLLNERFPEYMPSVRRYLNGERYEAENLLVGLVPDRTGRLDLLFDFSSVGPYHNGTFVVCKEILARATKLWPQFHIHVMASDEARRFHRLDKIERVYFVPIEVQRKFAVAFRFAQPFTLEQMTRLSRLAPVNVYGMLDPIAFDCLYLNTRNADDLESLWAAVFAHADGVVFISDFAAELFRRRFPFRPGLRELVAYPSLDFREYMYSQATAPPGERHILVIGNRFEHKRVLVTADALSKAFPRDKIVVLGFQHENGQNVVSYDSGHLEDQHIHALFSGARFVVFPSLYEGFGFPVIESLAYQRPVLARSVPLFHTIREKVDQKENIILYSSTSDLIERLKRGFPSWRNNGDASVGDPSAGWDSTSLQIGNFLSDVARSFDLENVLLPRIRHMRLLGQRAANSGDVAPAFLKDFLAKGGETQIQEIYASWSWRLTSPMRWLGSTYLRMRSR
jgi:GT2 family glycosyltransferase